MAKQGIDTGGLSGIGADTLYEGALKINNNFDEIYNTFGDGTTLNPSLGSGDLLVTGIATVGLANTSTPPNNSQLSFELISDTQLRIKVRGSDGVLRSADITLA